MNSERKIKELKRKIQAMLEASEDGLATSVVELCRSTIQTIETNRVGKLRVWKEFYEPPRVAGRNARKDSVEYKEKIVHKYYHLHKTLPALEKLRDIDLVRQDVLKELNNQVLVAEQWEKQEDLKKQDGSK
ncbi:hypothetical protein SBOR_0678 [Sclerotinia borealis F-4128]|uniref:Uncharacterized protein n=1 Tax=Sclerotinia borealis (strain F-4128) TaxID=1432307 RepID=W9CQ44_SCLBF|nr:hypothetical protein SBOR_0678 [Sclerotinia borealis F-4128]